MNDANHFIADVQKRLLPFGVVVQFEVSEKRISCSASRTYGGVTYRARHSISTDRLRWKTWPGEATAHTMLTALMKCFGYGMQLAGREEEPCVSIIVDAVDAE